MNSKKREKRDIRVTIGLNRFLFEIIEKLVSSSFGEDRSKVIYNIIIEWIYNNTKRLLNYEIDVAKIQSQFHSDLEKETIKSIIKALHSMFEGISSIRIEHLAEEFETKPKIIRKLFYSYYQELKNEKLILILEDDMIKNRSPKILKLLK